MFVLFLRLTFHLSFPVCVTRLPTSTGPVKTSIHRRDLRKLTCTERVPKGVLCACVYKRVSVCLKNHIDCESAGGYKVLRDIQTGRQIKLNTEGD